MSHSGSSCNSTNCNQDHKSKHYYRKVSHIVETSQSVHIFKSCKPDEKGNHSPINILCTLSKIIERYVHKHLYNYFTLNNLLHLAQSGFRKFHSCETAISKMASQWAANMNDGNLTGLVLLDLHKAFDMVDHKIPLQKLSLSRLSDMSLQWFRSYLTDRQQVVRFNGSVSDSFPVISGVP